MGPEDRGLLFTVAEDIREVDLDGRGDLDGGYGIPNEFHIHTELFRARPDVQAVVHAHPRDVMIADLAGVQLRQVFGAYNIPASRLANQGVPVYRGRFWSARRNWAGRSRRPSETPGPASCAGTES